MLEKPTSKVYDLESRTLAFAKSIRHFITKLDKSILNIDDAKQLIRSSGSIAANYIEANESITKREFIHRANISKKEAKETQLWLSILVIPALMEDARVTLLKESIEITKILGAILEKCR